MTIKTLLKIMRLNLFILLLLPTVAFSTSPDFNILTRDDYGIVLEFRLPPFEISSIQGENNQDYQRLEVAQWAKTDTVGAPELPFTATLLQVPPTGDLSVEIEQQDDNTAPLTQLYPVPQPRLSDHGDIVPQFTQDATAYRTASFYPNQVITLDQRAILRNEPIVRVKVFPFQWNPRTQTLRYTTYLRFRLQFAQPLPPVVASENQPPVSSYDRLLRSIINGYQPRQPQTAIDSRQIRDNKTNFDGPRRYSINLKIKQTSMYHVTYEELLATGLPESCLSQGQWVIYNQGQQIVPQVKTRNHWWFSPGDSLQFYAQRLDNTYTDTNTYRLDCWQISRPRPAVAAAAPAEEPKISRWGNVIDGTVNSTAPPLTSFQETLHVEQNLVQWENTPGAPQQDYWFWEKITAPDQQNVTLTTPTPATTPPPNTETFILVGLRGFSTATPHPDHHTQIYLNNVAIGDYNWDADRENVQKLPFFLNVLKDGDNTLRIKSPGDTGAKTDVIYTNWVEITYPRQLVADQDQLKFTITGKGRQPIRVSHLSTQDVKLYDITDPTHLKEVINFSIQPEKEGNGYQVTFEDKINGQKTYYLLSSAQLRQVDNLTLLPPTHLKQPTNGADYILITIADFLPVVQPLVERRAQQGLRATAIDIEDIYNEFGFGAPTPQAIKDFLTYTYQHWQPPAPSYVLLWGDATLDYKGYLNNNKKLNLIPAYMVPTVYSLAPSDNWYVSIQGEDSLPEMMIGRLPSHSVDQVKTLVNKILNYETNSNLSPSMLMIADNDSSFEAASDEAIKLIPSNIAISQVYLGKYQNDKEATADVITHLDEGMLITHYLGHGNATLWANSTGQRLFEVSDIGTLKDTGKYTFLIVLNCLNANFSDVARYSLAEQFILAVNKGTFASFAPSSVGYLWEHQLIDNSLFRQIFEKNSRKLGEITTQAKLAAYSSGVSEHTLSTFLLLGDPASELQLPIK